MFYNPTLNKEDLIKRLQKLDDEIVLNLFSMNESISNMTK